MKLGETVDGRYVIEALAGEGGMASVYRARDLGSGTVVALKLLHLAPRSFEDDQRFNREARILAQLRHPGIVRYIGHNITSLDEAYLVLEWLSGETLHERLASGPLSVPETMTVGIHVANALAAAHAGGVIHRDIKPHNLFLKERDIERVTLLDFGVARRQEQTQFLTSTGVFLGTPAYASPEQVRSDNTIDARADIFSLGCVLFECLTGKSPFWGAQVLAILAKILFDEAPPVAEVCPQVPRRLSDLIARMLSKAPEERPASAEEISSELMACSAVVATNAVSSFPPVSALTEGEQRFVSILLASPRDAGEAARPTTLSEDQVEALRKIVQEHAARLSAQVERLENGAVLAALVGSGAATDLAVQAARCARAWRSVLPNAEIVLTTGRAVVRGRLPVGQAIDRAVALLQQRLDAPGSAAAGDRNTVHLDTLSADLLSMRFSIAGGPGAPELQGEKEPDEGTRKLLGKPTPCVGRDRELAALEGLWNGCVEEPRACVAVVTGPAGIGKSRLRFEFVKQRRRESGAPSDHTSLGVWLAEGDPLRAGSPFGMLRQMLRRAAFMLEQEPLAIQQQKLVSFVTERLGDAKGAAVAALLGDIAGAPFPDEASPDLHAARGDPAKLNDLLKTAFGALVAAECEKRPLLVVVEDMHWSDNASMQLISATLRRCEESPLFVLVLARPEVHEVFPKLFANEGMQEIRLRELSRKASLHLAREVLGQEADSTRVQKIVERAGGNAFYLEEILRAIAEGNDSALPETVLGMVESRLLSLDPEARRVLRAGSIFGEVFWAGGAAMLLARASGDGRLEDWLGTLVERELIMKRPDSKLPGESEYAFRHALVREAAYGMLTDEDRTLGHRLAGEWLEGVLVTPSSEAPEAFSLIGEHYRRGEAWLEASDYLQKAADAAAKLFAIIEASAYYESARLCVERLPDTEQTRLRRLHLLVRYNDLVFMSDLPERSMKRLIEAEELARSIAAAEARLELARICGALGRMHVVMGQMSSARHYLGQSIDTATALGAEELAASSLALLCVAAAAQGRWSEASGYHTRAMGPLERAGDWTNFFIAVGTNGMATSVRGHYDKAIRVVGDLPRRAAELKHPTALSLSYNYTLYAHFAGGNVPEMLKSAESSIEASDRSGDRMLGWVGYWIGAYALAHLGDHEGAARYAEQARTILKELGGKLFIAHWSFATDAVRLLLARRFEEAIATALEAISLSNDVGDIFGRGIAERVLGQARARLDAPAWEVIDAHFAESARLLQESEAALEFARTQEAWGLSYRDRGVDERGRELLSKALDRFEALGREQDAERVRAQLS